MDRTDKTRYETVYLRDEISRCEDVFELKERILPMLKIGPVKLTASF